MIFKKWWEGVLTLKKENLPRFILLCTRVGLGFLFFVALLLPYFKMIQFGAVVARQSSVSMPGGWIFLILTLALMAGIAYSGILKDQWLRPMLLVQGIQMSALWLWSLVILIMAGQAALEYPEASCQPAFGMFVELIVLGLLWFAVFGEKILMKFLEKRWPSRSVAPEAEAAPAPEA